MKDWKLLAVRIVLAVAGVGLGYFATSGGTVEEPRDQNGALSPSGDVSEKTEWEQSADDSPRIAYERRLLQVAEADYENVEELLAELEMPKDIDLVQKLLLGLVKHDGRKALQLFEELEMPESYSRWTESYFRTLYSSASFRGWLFMEWAKRDVEGASAYFSEWASSQPEWSPDRRSAVKQVVGELIKSDRERARIIAAESGLEDWFDQHADANSLAEKLEQFHGREESDGRAFSNMLYQESRKDPDAVYEALLAMPRDVNIEDRISWLRSSYSGERLVEIKRHFSPESEVEDWSEVPLTRERWFGSGVQDWAAKDREKTLEWVAQLPEGEREHFRGMALIGAAISDPDWALEQIGSLPEGKREQAQIAIAPDWFNRDPQAVREWIESLPDEALRVKVQAATNPNPIGSPPN